MTPHPINWQTNSEQEVMTVGAPDSIQQMVCLISLVTIHANLLYALNCKWKCNCSC